MWSAKMPKVLRVSRASSLLLGVVARSGSRNRHPARTTLTLIRTELAALARCHEVVTCESPMHREELETFEVPSSLASFTMGLPHQPCSTTGRPGPTNACCSLRPSSAGCPPSFARPAAHGSNNQDPMVRGLALRSLCSLRLPAMVEYISDPLKASLTDANSYVRKTGVMAILKMWHLWPQAVEDGAMVDTLYNMLYDNDAQVRLSSVEAARALLARVCSLGAEARRKKAPRYFRAADRTVSRRADGGSQRSMGGRPGPRRGPRHRRPCRARLAPR